MQFEKLTICPILPKHVLKLINKPFFFFKFDYKKFNKSSDISPSLILFKFSKADSAF